MSTNLVIAISTSYYFTAFARLIGGFPGVLWPMISAYAMRLVSPEQHGRAIAIVMLAVLWV